MGYDIARFDGEIDEELLCPICSGVLEDPVQVSMMHIDWQTSIIAYTSIGRLHCISCST